MLLELRAEEDKEDKQSCFETFHLLADQRDTDLQQGEARPEGEE